MLLTNDSNIHVHVHKKYMYITLDKDTRRNQHLCALIIIILDLLIVTTITIDIKLLWPSWSCFYFIYLDHRRRHLGSHGHHCVPFDAQGLSKGNPSLRTARDHFSFSLRFVQILLLVDLSLKKKKCYCLDGICRTKIYTKQPLGSVLNAHSLEVSFNKLSLCTLQ